MSVLDLDVGNSRIKWRLTGTDRRGCLPGDRLSSLALTERPRRVRISSVARAEVNLAIGEWCRRTGVAPEFARVRSSCAGVICGYLEPERLGVDRWLAVLAAWDRYRRAVAVIDAGTAVTLDFVDSGGRHRGGYVVPGLARMRTSLATGTAGVRVAEPGELLDLAPGRVTGEAVNRGMVRMLADFAVASVARFRRDCEDSAAVVLTGGDADVLARHLEMAVDVRADLVLDGLAIALP